MGPDPKILDDIAKAAGGAVNILSGMQQQIREEIKTRMDDMAARMDLVPREDLDRAEAMIEKLRKQQAAKKAPAAKKTAAKKATSKKAK